MSTVEEQNTELVARFTHSMETHPDGSAAAWVSGANTLEQWCTARNKRMDNLSRVDIDDYLEFVSREYFGSTAGVKFASVHKFYSWCERKQLHENIAEGLERSQYGITTDTTRQARALKQQEDYIAIPRDEVMQIAANVPSPKSRNESLVRLMWDTGMRCSEVVEIGSDDIEWDDNRIDIYARKTDDHRSVWFSDATRMVLREWVDIDRETTGKHADSESLFLTTHSPNMRSSHVSRIVKESAQEAGINEVLYRDKNDKQRWKVTGHTIRHSMASYHANVLETPVHLIKQMLGHSKLETTMQYVKEDREAVKRAMKRI